MVLKQAVEEEAIHIDAAIGFSIRPVSMGIHFLEIPPEHNHRLTQVVLWLLVGQGLAGKIHESRQKKAMEAPNCATVGAGSRGFHVKPGGPAMATACIPQVTFEFYEKLNPVVARFDKAKASTDGCAVLLKALDERLRLTDRLAACVSDRRDPDKIRHTTRDLLRQRIMGLACLRLAVWVEGSVRRSSLYLPQFAPWGARMATGGRGGGRHAGLTARPVSCRNAARRDQFEVCVMNPLFGVYPHGHVCSQSGQWAHSTLGRSRHQQQMGYPAIQNGCHVASRHRS